MDAHQEAELLRSAALQNAHSILLARQKAERELVAAKEALEAKAQELDESLASMRATLEATTNGILVTDGSGRITDVNRRFAETWNIRMDEMGFDHHHDLLHMLSELFADPAAFIAQTQNIFTQGNEPTFEVLELKDGRVLERFSRPQLIKGVNVGRVWSIQDVTEHKRAEEALRESEQQLKITFNQAAVGIAIADLKGRFLHVNERFSEILGYSSLELQGLTFRDLTYVDDLDVTDSKVSGLLDGIIRDYSLEKRYVRKDGQIIWILATVTVIRDSHGAPLRFVGVIEDFTSRKKAEEERMQLLESERTARIEAEHLGRLKDEFLATLSHELRTPLNAILGWAHLIKMNATDSKKVLEGAEVIERNARTQSQLVADLLDMSRIIAGKMRLDVQRVQLPALIEAALDSIRPQAELKGVRIETILDPIEDAVNGDPGRLQQILWNLLSNAAKFTPKGGKIQVVLCRINSHVEIMISDSGRGIDPAFLPYIFERFRQEDASATRHHGGLGIGLALVKQLTELHGGKVRAVSGGEGMGATFVLELPLAVAPATSSSQDERLHPRTSIEVPAGEPPDLTGLRILVLDDEADAREFLKRLLNDCNAEVATRGSVRDALAYAESQPFDLVISDIGMPVRDGYEFIRELRTRGLTMPAIALTAFARTEDRTRTLASGYQAHLAKPVEPYELLALVGALADRVKRVGTP